MLERLGSCSCEKKRAELKWSSALGSGWGSHDRDPLAALEEGGFGKEGQQQVRFGQVECEMLQDIQQ